MSFDSKYTKIKRLVSAEISLIEKEMDSLIKTKEPLNTSIKNFLNSPSKRIRPVLSLLYLKSSGENVSKKQIQLLTAVELVHNASLVHDDIIDESPIRRGEKTLYTVFGNKIGVICGDYLLSLAMKIIAQIGSVQILEKFSDTLNKMCIGEINQNYSKFKIGTIEDYIEKSKNKTAYLFETALYSGLLLTDKTFNVEKATNFAQNFGIAFQMRDDILNLTPKDEKKPSKNDIEEGIYNAPVIYAQSVEQYDKGIEKAKSLLNNYIELAKEQIISNRENEYHNALIELLELLKNE